MCKPIRKMTRATLFQRRTPLACGWQSPVPVSSCVGGVGWRRGLLMLQSGRRRSRVASPSAVKRLLRSHSSAPLILSHHQPASLLPPFMNMLFLQIHLTCTNGVLHMRCVTHNSTTSGINMLQLLHMRRTTQWQKGAPPLCSLSFQLVPVCLLKPRVILLTPPNVLIYLVG